MPATTSMPKTTILVGALLTVVAVIAYFATGMASPTALIPAAIGLPIVLCGYLAQQEKYRQHAIHAAMVIALLGALGSLMNVAKIGDLFAGTAERPGAIITSTIMLIVCAAYIALGVRSFKAARLARTSDSR